MSKASAGGGEGKGGGDRRAGQEAEGPPSQGQVPLARPRGVDRAARQSPRGHLPAHSDLRGASGLGTASPEGRGWRLGRPRAEVAGPDPAGGGRRHRPHVAHGPVSGARHGVVGASLTPLAAAMRTMSWMASFM